MKLEDHYDWVVLGDDPATLLSACLMSHLGASVLILPLAPSQLARVSTSGQWFDPEPNFTLGLWRTENANGFLSDLFTRLGVPMAARPFSGPEPGLLEVVSPGARVGLYTDLDQFLFGIERELGPESIRKLGLDVAVKFAESVTLKYWRHLHKQIFDQPSRDPLWRYTRFVQQEVHALPARARPWFSSRKSLSSAIALAGDSRGEEIMRGITYGLSGRDLGDPEAIRFAMLLGHSSTAGRTRGGVTELRRFLRKLAASKGADDWNLSPCRRVFVENGRFIGVQVASSGKMLSVGGGIVGCELGALEGLVCYSGKPRARLRKMAPARGWKITFALTVRAEALPPGCLRRVIWQEPGARALEIEVVSPDEYHLPQEGLRILYLRTHVPFTHESLSLDFQRKIVARMYRRAIEIFPFLEFHVVRMFPDFRHTDPTRLTDEFTEAYGIVSPEFIPGNLRDYGECPSGSQTGLEGLYCVSGKYPELGNLGGHFASVESVAEHCLTRGMEREFREFWS